MRVIDKRETVSRRDFLAGSGKTALGTAMVVGTGTLMVPTAGWGMEVKALKPETMATLIQIARDIYPHDQVHDKYYAKAVKGFDDDSKKDMVEGGVAGLDKAAGEGGYLGTGWEADRVDLLKDIEDSDFFQAVRGTLVVSLYNQKALWPLFGYEGASADKGGYIERGFNDIDWI